MKKQMVYGLMAFCVVSLFAIAHFAEKSGQTINPLLTAIDSTEIDIDTIPNNYYQRKGIVSDTLILFQGEIAPNQSLSEILLKYGVSYAEIDHIAKKSKSVFDVRKFNSGKNFIVFCSEDTIQKAKYFIYEQDAANYIVYGLTDPFIIEKGRKEVEIVIKMASGIINSSLWQTTIDNGINPNVPLKLSEIYAWAVDFYRIQKGDMFKLIYEEKVVEGKTIGIGEVKAAYFKHYGEDYYAIYFEQGDAADYFDENSKSLRKAFLKAPLQYSRISSKFSMKRFHPVQKRYKAHLGTDYAAPRGTPIMSTGDGKVIKAGFTKGNGNYVKVKHNSVYSTQYLHMQKIKSGIRKGKRVRQGDVLGYVGSTGLATGPHVCYRFWKNGKQVDALKVKIPASLPIDKKYLVEYNKVKDLMISKLDSIPSALKPTQDVI